MSASNEDIPVEIKEDGVEINGFFSASQISETLSRFSGSGHPSRSLLSGNAQKDESNKGQTSPRIKNGYSFIQVTDPTQEQRAAMDDFIKYGWQEDDGETSVEQIEHTGRYVREAQGSNVTGNSATDKDQDGDEEKV